MLEVIGEFKGKNTGFRVLPDGKIETTAQGSGKILGIDAFLIATYVGTMVNGVYIGEVTSVINTMDGDAVIMKGNAIGRPSENGGTSRAASYQMTQSQKLARLNQVIGLHEYETDRDNNWTGKIWEWK